MSYKEEIDIFFDAVDTMKAFIAISEICELELNTYVTKSATIKQPCSMCSAWRAKIAQHVLDDILTCHPLFTKIEALVITDDDLLTTFCNPDGTYSNCGHPNTFHRKMKNVIKMNTMFRIALKLQSTEVVSLGLPHQDTLTIASRFSIPTLTVIWSSLSCSCIDTTACITH
jgi:hypothetical protein